MLLDVGGSPDLKIISSKEDHIILAKHLLDCKFHIKVNGFWG
jgi:hypothetical protein